MSQIPVIVISLARAPDRRVAISEHLRSLGLTFEIMDAVDGKLLSHQEQTDLLAPGVTYVPGVIGCYVSHIHAYQWIVKNRHPVALVLEDDARLNPKIVPYLKAGNINFDYDFCLLDSDDCSEDTPVFYDIDSRETLAAGFPIYKTNIGPALLHAYLVSQTGAERRLSCAWPIQKPVDVYSSLPIALDIRVCVEPKGAYVSEHSRQSFTSDRNDQTPLRLKFLRRFSWYFKLRDVARFKSLRGYLQIKDLVQRGILPAGKRWRAMPTGRNITS